MIEREKIKDVLPVFLEYKDQSDSDITDRLTHHGLNLTEAERVSAFLPSAFCRIVLGHKLDLNFPNTYKVYGKEGEYAYSEEPIYKLAIDIASEIYHNESEFADIFNSIVARSAEFNVVNQALNKGSEITGSSLQATTYFGYKTLGKKRSLLSRIFG
ncbi:hypothetical protein [Pseudoalteromonas obscura]|uniref:Uncharacterized protein n=1 Tax=Pseudoalteromonas obscura TaxID=3048491 RepID=A0ABT7EFE9_9GAMM|nr:hypothetical protein [Pseudoalteromonas sp. P94(2023)]MDK2594012.1 hypothetical protein [Pseudoalteromonas sp. P94(2023)]